MFWLILLGWTWGIEGEHRESVGWHVSTGRWIHSHMFVRGLRRITHMFNGFSIILSRKRWLLLIFHFLLSTSAPKYRLKSKFQHILIKIDKICDWKVMGSWNIWLKLIVDFNFDKNLNYNFYQRSIDYNSNSSISWSQQLILTIYFMSYNFSIVHFINFYQNLLKIWF